MEFNELFASREAIQVEASDRVVAMTAFIEAQESILRWFSQWNLYPTKHTVKLPHTDCAVRVVFTFSNDALVPFAGVESAFWSFIRGLMPLDPDRFDEHATCFLSAEFRESDWDVVVVPDLYSSENRFPGMEFWEAEVRREQERLDRLANSLRLERTVEALTGLIQARADSERLER